ncbi:MAG TPA: YbhB/YbcL family Raf kinase inhibitor-like protein [Actinomycetes bacterium]|nr:YbhB/YbcL family Raf kinase inhibitor-like protein [Actinomycetes bacterium]
MPRWMVVLAAVVSLAAACSGGGGREVQATVPESIKVSSPAFAEGAPIPPRYACTGAEVSPPLTWSGTPDDAAELALVVDDPDAPRGTFVHWVLFHLDPKLTRLDEGQVPVGAAQARNSAGRTAYRGPCPPAGPAHHYRFTVYALGSRPDLPDGAGLERALDAIERAATARGRLTGTFAR